jgi:hypothetical protein
MDAQDFRSLQEAYMEVVMNEGHVELDKKRQRRMTDQAMRHMNKGDDASWEKAYKIEDERDTQTPEVSKAKATANRERGEAKRRTQKEEVDIYDIILLHLLDEGYAETPEAAKKIMLNMSEEWRESIVEAAVDYEMSSDEMEKARNERKFGKQEFNQPGQTQLRRKLHKSQRGMKKKDVRRWEGEK